MQISDHKWEAWGLCHFWEGCGNPFETNKQTKKIKSLVVVMGWFHTLMVTGTHFEDAGLQDILIQNEVLTDGFAERATTGSMYNHSVCICKLMF